MATLQIILGIVVIWNILVFLLYGLDKLLSVNKAPRIPESSLIFCSFLLGGVGAIIGMYFLRHKTRTSKFKILIPIAVLLTTALVILAFVFIK